MRAALILLPLALGAVVLAQDKAEEKQQEEIAILILKLGHEDYAVREGATRRLIELEEKAVPALEAALKSTDLEVRMRAGRALRAIRTKEGVAEKVPFGPANSSKSRAVKIEITDGKVKVSVREMVDGKEQTRSYEAASIEELKKEHPELKDVLGGVRFRVNIDPLKFDMDRFWKNWPKDFNNDFWRNQKRYAERLQRWARRAKEQQRDAINRWRRGIDATQSGRLLGIRAVSPDAVLDAQLGLRGRGLVVHGVELDTPAASLGIKRFDVLIELDGKEVRATGDIARIMRARKKDAPLTGKVIRAGRELSLSTRD